MKALARPSGALPTMSSAAFFAGRGHGVLYYFRSRARGGPTQRRVDGDPVLPQRFRGGPRRSAVRKSPSANGATSASRASETECGLLTERALRVEQDRQGCAPIRPNGSSIASAVAGSRRDSSRAVARKNPVERRDADLPRFPTKPRPGGRTPKRSAVTGACRRKRHRPTEREVEQRAVGGRGRHTARSSVPDASGAPAEVAQCAFVRRGRKTGAPSASSETSHGPVRGFAEARLNRSDAGPVTPSAKRPMSSSRTRASAASPLRFRTHASRALEPLRRPSAARHGRDGACRRRTLRRG